MRLPWKRDALSCIFAERFVPRGGRGGLVACVALLLILFGACSPELDPLRRASALAQEGEIDEALALLRKAVEAEPSNPGINHAFGIMLLRNGQAGLAVWPLRRAAEDPARRHDASVHLATALLSSQNGHEAIRVINEVLEAQPERFDALRLRANAYLSIRDWDALLADVAMLMETFPAEWSLHDTRVSALMALKRYDEASAALSDLREEVEALPVPPEGVLGRICAQRAELIQKEGDDEAALGKLEGCLEEFPGQDLLLHVAPGFYDRAGKSDEGTQLLRDFASDTPESLAVQLRFVQRLEATGDVPTAKVILEDTAARLNSLPAHLALRDFLIRNDDLEAAIAVIQKAVALEPTTVSDGASIDYSAIPDDRLFGYADVLAQGGEFGLVSAMLRHISEPVYVDLLEARVAFEKGALEEALKHWDDSFVRWPSNPGARYLAAQAALDLGDFDTAISHLRESLRADPSVGDAGGLLAEIHLAQGDIPSALNALFHHQRGHPDDTETLRLHASVAVLNGKHGLAEQIRTVLAVEHGLEDEAIADHTADMALVQGPRAALDYLENTVEPSDLESGNYTNCLRSWWDLSVQVGDPEEAARRVQKAAEAHPDDPELQILHASVLRSQEQTQAAGLALDKARQLSPNSAHFWIETGLLALEAEQLDLAVDAFDRASEIQQRDTSALRFSVAALVDAKRYTGARERLLKAVEERPWDGASAHWLAALAVRQETPDDLAMEMARRAIRFPYGMGKLPLFTLAQLELLRGDPESALSKMHDAIQFGVAGPTALYWLGRAHAAAGNSESASRALQDALEAGDFPESEAAKRLITNLTSVPQNRDGS